MLLSRPDWIAFRPADDDGQGFDSSIGHPGDRYHYGLLGMRERVESVGGEFHLASSPGTGTQFA